SDCYNREHTFPQNWFTSGTSTGPGTDYIQVLPTDGKVNGQRSNWVYGEVGSTSWTSLNGSKLGSSAVAGVTGTVFEPINAYKGDLARVFLYMVTRYENNMPTWGSLSGSNGLQALEPNTFPSIDLAYLQLMIKWHNQDPVSQKEIDRNNAAYAFQGNRNPFVDSPQFVQRIWGGNIPSEPTVGAYNLQVTNINNNSVKLNWVSGNGNRRLVLVRAGSAVNTFPTDTFHYSFNSSITAAPQIGSGNYVVYNGTGSTVTLTNMQAGVTYHYAVIEYNGWYSTANYNTGNILSFNAVTLPVTWLSFDGVNKNQSNQLTWSTASEKNNKVFVVERSLDDENFVATGIVNGVGNSNVVSKYQYTDNQLPDATAFYYRLKQIDIDGKFSYSKVVKIGIDDFDMETGFTVGPNPFTQNIRISYQLKQPETVYYVLMNSKGLKIKEGYETANQNEGEFVIDVDNSCADGLYFLQIKYNNRNIIHKIIKQ
ncbi:MAG: endonuclease, partial [Bacteroidia bacterium]